MFYKQFIKLCEENGEKPTTVLKKLGFSVGNLKKWSEGSTVNSNILLKTAEYFNVPVDCFFADKFEDENISKGYEGNPLKYFYNIIRAHPDFVMSLRSGFTVSKDIVLCISEYLKRPPDYFVKDLNELGTSSSQNSKITPKDEVIKILSEIPATDLYRYIQVKISMIIIDNLKRIGINKEDLINIGLLKKKINELHDLSIDFDKKTALYFSDLVNISEKLNVSLDYMFTGTNE